MVLIGLTIFFPFLWASLLNKKWYDTFHYICRLWARYILFSSGFRLQVEFEEKLDSSKAYIICPNHVSYIDIPVVYATIPSVFVFIGKKSLAKLPVFGWIYKRTMILVDRSSKKSSYKAFKKASERVNEGVGITIYPEGGIPDNSVKLQKFKNGAFRMAIEQNVDMVPVTFIDNKKRFPSGKLAGCPGLLRVYVHKPIIAGTYNLQTINEFKSHVYNALEQKINEYESR